MTFKQIFISSIGRKLIMGFSGIFLILFLLVHAGINACIFANDGGDMFNRVAHFMGANVVPRVLEIGLFVGFILHIIQGYLLTVENSGKRSQPYAVAYKVGSKWYSRSMAILGSILFIFLIIHLGNFWVPSRITYIDEIILSDGVRVHDLYALMRDTFSNIYIVLVYLVACFSLGYHLAHGFQSAFKTIGVAHTGYLKLLNKIGIIFSIFISILFAIMPICFYFGIIN